MSGGDYQETFNQHHLQSGTNRQGLSGTLWLRGDESVPLVTSRGGHFFIIKENPLSCETFFYSKGKVLCSRLTKV